MVLRISTKFGMMDYFVPPISNIDYKYSITNTFQIRLMRVLVFYWKSVSEYTQWARIGGQGVVHFTGIFRFKAQRIAYSDYVGFLDKDKNIYFRNQRSTAINCPTIRALQKMWGFSHSIHPLFCLIFHPFLLLNRLRNTS